MCTVAAAPGAPGETPPRLKAPPIQAPPISACVPSGSRCSVNRRDSHERCRITSQ
jgi:hypothetical protein